MNAVLNEPSLRLEALATELCGLINVQLGITKLLHK